MRLQVIGSNQTLVYCVGQEYFFSYNTCVAGKDDQGNYWKTDKKYSNTTSRHVKAYLNGADPVLVTESEAQLALDCV